MADSNGAREAFAESMSEELGRDLNDDFMQMTDRMLIRLYMFGFIIVPLDEKVIEHA